MESSLKPTTFHLCNREDIHQIKSLIVEKLKSKQFRSVELVAFDTLTDYAVQLAIMIKSEMQHGLHQTTNVGLVQGN